MEECLEPQRAYERKHQRKFKTRGFTHPNLPDCVVQHYKAGI